MLYNVAEIRTDHEMGCMGSAGLLAQSFNGTALQREV
jgi:hypothetical protein